jgi:phage/plasmid-like protein (TIGR03299 family)
MAHEITATDNVVLTKKSAWHGLGLIVEDAPSPTEALKLAKLDWEVRQWPLKAYDEHTDLRVATHVANIRSDTLGTLGVVGATFKPVQNVEMAEFCAALGASSSAVQVESAGSIRGGKRVWFLLRGDSIWVDGKDEVKPYLLVCNGHDGTLAFTCMPTTIRIVCSNTLHLALRKGDASRTTIRFRHEGQIGEKLEDVKRALGIFTDARERFEEQSNALNAKEMSRTDLQRFWMEVYSTTLDEIPATPTTSKEIERAENCRKVLGQWAANFDKDRARLSLPPSAWVGLNAVTEWFDHQKVVRAADDGTRKDNRVLPNWWGSGAVELALSR